MFQFSTTTVLVSAVLPTHQNITARSQQRTQQLVWLPLQEPVWLLQRLLRPLHLALRIAAPIESLQRLGAWVLWPSYSAITCCNQPIEGLFHFSMTIMLGRSRTRTGNTLQTRVMKPKTFQMPQVGYIFIESQIAYLSMFQMICDLVNHFAHLPLLLMFGSEYYNHTLTFSTIAYKRLCDTSRLMMFVIHDV